MRSNFNTSLSAGLIRPGARGYTPAMAEKPPTTRPRRRPPASASPARVAALDIFSAVIGRGLPLQETIAQYPGFDALEPRDRRQCRRLISLTLRHHGEARALLQQHLARLPSGRNTPASHILMMASAEMIWGEGEAHAVVDQSVRLAKASGFGHLAGLTNAVLRKIAAGREETLAAEPQPMLNLPDWLARELDRDWGAEAEAIAHSLMALPGLDLTVRKDAASWAERLGGTRLAHGSIRVADGHVPALEGYQDGAWWVQDAAASLPAQLMGPLAGKRVADCCAAPGGKTAQLCAAGAEVIALDSSSQRLERLQENMARLGFSPEVITADATTWRPDAPLDAVLIDAPCSATGTIRRRPDILSHQKAPDFHRLAEIQRGLLNAATAMVKPGGVVIYATCSLLRREGEAIVKTPPQGLAPMAFDAAEMPAGFTTMATAGAHTMRLMPDALRLDTTANMPQGNDGFFIARFTRC